MLTSENGKLRTVAAIVIGIGGVASIVASGGGGGGGGSDTTPSAAQGLWYGTASNGRAVYALVLDDGTYWVTYSVQGNGALAGLIQGNGRTSGNAFSSSNAKDFNFEGLGINSASMAADFAEQATFDGSITYPTLSDTVTFNMDYEPAYDLVPSLTNLAGTYDGWALPPLGGDFATVTISPAGAITGSDGSGCNFHGTASVHPSGNVYDIAVTFEGGTCGNGTGTVRGVAFLDPLNSIIFSSALNSNRTNGFLFVGTKT